MEVGIRWKSGLGRCAVTGNICGTDTWSVGQPCKCIPCQAYITALDEVGEVLDETGLTPRQLAEQLKILGTITPCPNCDGSGQNEHGSCCRIPGHARECTCTLCRWKNSRYAAETVEIELKAERERLAERVNSLETERDNLVRALVQIKQYFLDLENGTRDDDLLKRLRNAAHAPFHRVIDAALAEADAKEPGNG